MSHPEDNSCFTIMSQRDYRSLAILAGLVANPECVHQPVELLVHQAVRLADALGSRLAEPVPEPAPAAAAVARNWCGGPLRYPMPGQTVPR